LGGAEAQTGIDYAVLHMGRIDSVPALPPGWSCNVELAQNTDGAYAGRAVVTLEGVERCVLLISQQPSEAAALERISIRAQYFISEWMSRPHTGDTGLAELEP
jgi:hypothetical protein